MTKMGPLPLRRVTLAEALAAMETFAVRPARTEAVAVTAAEGRILAEDIRAREDVPAFRRSRVDGYAVIAADVTAAADDAPVSLRVVSEIPMGKAANFSLRRGEAARIATGGALPCNATGVVMVEDTTLRDGVVTVADGSDCAEYITEAGADLRAGAPLFARGTPLSPAALGLLAATGVTSVGVYAPPRVGLIVTGDELVSGDVTLEPGQIRDINSVSIPAALAAMGFLPLSFGRVKDDFGSLAATVARALRESDAVLISGGSSVGERDHTEAVIAAAGKPGVVVHGVKAKPGRPALLGMIDDVPVFGLPGNPVSALIVLESLVKPVLLRMFAIRPSGITIRATLTATVEESPELEHRVPVRLRAGNAGVEADPLVGTSAQMHTTGFADGMLLIPLGTGTVAKGTRVDIMPFSRTRTLA